MSRASKANIIIFSLVKRFKIFPELQKKNIMIAVWQDYFVEENGLERANHKYGFKAD